MILLYFHVSVLCFSFSFISCVSMPVCSSKSLFQLTKMRKNVFGEKNFFLTDIINKKNCLESKTIKKTKCAHIALFIFVLLNIIKKSKIFQMQTQSIACRNNNVFFFFCFGFLFCNSYVQFNDDFIVIFFGNL